MTINNQNRQNSNQNDYISNITETPKDATQDDLLNSEYFTDGLVDYIEHADSPLSISLNGEWGSGKTSIMNTIKNKLCEGDSAKFHGIWVNTWQFSLLDSSPAPQAVVRILQSIVNQILRLKPDYDRRKQISQLISTLATISSGLKSFSAATGEPLFGVGKASFSLAEMASNALNKAFNTNSNQLQTDNAALVKQLSSEIQKLVDEVLTAPKSQDGHYEPYNPCLISKIPNYPCAKILYFIYFCLCNLSTMLVFVAYYLGLMFFNIIFGFVAGTVLSIVNSFSVTKALFDFCCYVVRVGDAICCNKEWSIKDDKRNGFIFFIDDLDRIEPSTALEVIEILASIFSFKKCIFILAIDRDILIKAAKLKLSKSKHDVDDMLCQKYLNRFVHISIPVPTELYNTQLLLRASLLNISFFTQDELNNELLDLLDKVVFYTIGKNPRSIKQLINGLSLVGVFEHHACANNKNDKHVPWQVDTLFREMIFIIQCININYPDLCIALATRPYFKMWDMDFAINCFNDTDKQHTRNLASKYNASCEWEYALFHICKFGYGSKSEFYNIRLVFKIIDSIFREHMLGYTTKQSEQYIYDRVISNIFFYFYRFIGGESKFGGYRKYVIKPSKTRCQNHKNKD